MSTKLPTKKTSETILADFNFIANLALDETITQAFVNVTLLSGVDPNPQDVKQGVPIITGGLVQQYFARGLAGNQYRVRVTAVTDQGQTLERAVNLTVIEGSDIDAIPPTSPFLEGELNGTEDAIDMVWTASLSPSGIAGYRLYDAATDILIVDQVGLTYEFSPVSAGNVYSFYVIAYDVNDLQSAPSNVVTINVEADEFPVLNWLNPSAETGDMTGWTVTQGNMRVRVNQPAREPPVGLNIFDGGTSALSKAHQRFELLDTGVPEAEVDAGNTQITLPWWGGTFIQTPADQPQINFIFRNAALAVISTFNSGYKDPANDVGLMRWELFSTEAPIPALTRFIDVQMDAKRNNGTNNDAAFDGVGPPVISLIA